MENTIQKRGTLWQTLVVDAALLTAACLIPAASHLLALPLYMLNPMLALLLAGILMSRDWQNVLAMSVLLPLVSFLMTGMPAAPKMLCMMAELATVAAATSLLCRRWAALPSVLVAIVAGKAVYYLLKAAVIAPAVLVGTDWKLQLLSVLLWGGLFALLSNRKTKR